MMTGLVLVIIIANPRATLSVPRVTRNDGIESRVATTPLMRPTIAPVARPAAAPTIQPL